MKQEFLIRVDVNTDENGLTRAQSFESGKWLVEIRKDIISADMDIVACIAHELGHVIAYNCGLPGAISDPRTSGRQFDYGAIMNSETEAWNVAEMMFKFNRSKQIALKSYEDVLVK